MTEFKKAFTVGAVLITIGTTSLTAFAASNYQAPAEAVARITGRTVESVVTGRIETGKTYGTIANEAGKLDEYKKESLEIKKDNLNAQVEAGIITQEKADAIIKTIEENQVNCDGTGTARIGQEMGARFGSNGAGRGLAGVNRGTGGGKGQGGRGLGIGGMGLQDGSCYTPAN